MQAVSTYYAHRARGGPSQADWADAAVIDAIWRLRQSHALFKVLGARKTWIVLRTDGLDVSRCVVERLMREMGWRGACKRRRVRHHRGRSCGDASPRPGEAAVCRWLP